jgi:hypothetical protein
MSEIIIPWSAMEDLTDADFPACVFNLTGYEGVASTTWTDTVGGLVLTVSSAILAQLGGAAYVDLPSGGITIDLSSGTLPSPGTKFPVLLFNGKASGSTARGIQVTFGDGTTGFSLAFDSATASYIAQDATHILTGAAIADADVAADDVVASAIGMTAAGAGFMEYFDTGATVAQSKTVTPTNTVDFSAVTIPNDVSIGRVTGLASNNPGVSLVSLFYLTEAPTQKLLQLAVRQMRNYPGLRPLCFAGLA